MTADRVFHIDVIGTPKPQGSKSAFKDRAGNARLKESNPLGHAAWRNAISQSAITAWAGRPRMSGPLELTVEFRFRMPMSRPAVDRRRGWAYMTVAPDLDKLVRSVGDALQAAGVVGNDSLFAVTTALKIEVVEDWVGASIDVIRQDYELGAGVDLMSDVGSAAGREGE